MKKLYLLCLILLPMLLGSCSDTSGEYIENYYTDAELTTAIRTCLTTSKDTALNQLCITDGFNDSETYRITLPDNTAFRTLNETLIAQDKSYLVDTLIQRMNRACEHSGNGLSSAFNSTISSLTFTDPSSLVYSSTSDAVTTYFRANCGTTMQSAAASIVSEQLQSTGATETWTEMQTAYYNATSTTIDFDMTTHATTGLLSAVYQEMAYEEGRIRTDSTHAIGSLSIFQ